MTDLDPEIWNNKTLGDQANNKRLDVVEKQELENRNAKLEGREPREVIVENNYPGWEPDRNVNYPSNATVVHFADEQENDVQDTAPTDPNPEDDPNNEPEPTPEDSTPETAQDEEENETQWQS